MKVVSIINFKGGVGKTTLTTNLGAYAASVGKRVLLIDIDPQTNLTFSFIAQEDWREKYSDKKTISNFFEAVQRREEVLPALSDLIISNVNGSKVDLLSSHMKLINSDLKLASLLAGNDGISLAANYMHGVSFLSKALSKLGKYDIVLIDCPPSFNLMVKNAIYASTYYIVPTKLDYLSTMGVDYLVDTLKKYEEECNGHIAQLNRQGYKQLSLNMLGVVPMMVTIRNNQPEKAQLKYLKKLQEEYYMFQWVRNNNEVFGTELFDKKGNIVPSILSRIIQRSDRKLIKHELDLLCEDFLKKLK